MSENFLLAGDIGGTKTILALFSRETGAYSPKFEKIIPSQNIQDLGDVAQQFLHDHQIKPAACCLGVAGPVFDGKVTVTKLGWQLTEETLQERLDIGKVTLINDLAATAYALPHLKSDDFYLLNKGKKSKYGNKTIVAPGTGLGEVFLTWGMDEYMVHSSEGSHALFAPGTKLQRELLDFLSNKYDHVTYDLICSGRGIPLIYSFLKQKEIFHEPTWLAEKLNQCDDQTPVILKSAMGIGQKAQIATQTIDIFLEILASEATNCALKILSTGGVYLAGGIPPRILEFLKRKTFLDLFSSRKPFQSFLSHVPLAVVINSKSALIGAACHGMKKLGWTV